MLQKLPGLTFAFDLRGFDPEPHWKDKMQNWLLKSVSIRGIGSSELIYIRKEEFDLLTPEDKEHYKDL
jgi:hypothetical protein